MKVLWLASWYPDPYEPVNGDFIQRHAKAVAAVVPVDVVHVVQIGKDVDTKDEVSVREEGNLREFVCSFSFRRTGIAAIDKIRYNLQFKRYYKNFLRKYAQQYGKPDLIHVHVPMKAGLMALYFSKKWSVPYIVSEHGSYYEPSAPDTFAKRSSFFRHNTKKICRQAQAVTNVSATIGNVMQQLFHLPQIQIIPNVVDVHLFKPVHHTNDVFKWLHVSTLGEQKNIPGLLQAFALLKEAGIGNWELILAGPGFAQHPSTVAALQLTNEVRFTGELLHDDVAVVMQEADAFVLFSWHENFPCVIIEALCSGLPVVSGDTGGIKEAIQPNNGLLVETGNVQQLAEALKQVMHNIQQYRPSVIAAEAADKYSAEKIGNQFYQLYQQVLAKYSS